MVLPLVCLVLAGMPRVEEREVKFPGSGGLELNGTLSTPSGLTGSVPAVILLPGSGPTDRNGNQAPALVTNLLAEIADRLAKDGFISLRFDKRAVGTYAVKWPNDLAGLNDFFSWESFVGDVRAGMEFLRKQPTVDGKRIIIAGHSEGSTIAMQLGHDLEGKPEAPAGLVLMAAPGRDYGALLREQVAASLKRSALPEPQHKAYNDFVDSAIKEIVKSGALPKEAPPAGLAPLFPPSALKLLRSYFTTDPIKLASRFSGPVLLIQGEKDIQVSIARDTPLLEAALKKREKGSFELVVGPSASHNLKTVADENRDLGITGPIVAPVLDKLVAWLKKL